VREFACANLLQDDPQAWDEVGLPVLTRKDKHIVVEAVLRVLLEEIEDLIQVGGDQVNGLETGVDQPLGEGVGRAGARRLPRDCVQQITNDPLQRVVEEWRLPLGCGLSLTVVWDDTLDASGLEFPQAVEHPELWACEARFDEDLLVVPGVNG